MRACSRKYGDGSPEAENLWGMVGLIHDFDYERWPTAEEHPYKGNEILKERGYSDEIRRAIMSHAEYSGVSRNTPMEKCLFACDELAGFITAVALIKPGKSLAEVDAKSVRKRMKDKAFARKVNRDDIINGRQRPRYRPRRTHHLLHRIPQAHRQRIRIRWLRRKTVARSTTSAGAFPVCRSGAAPPLAAPFPPAPIKTACNRTPFRR